MISCHCSAASIYVYEGEGRSKKNKKKVLAPWFINQRNQWLAKHISASEEGQCQRPLPQAVTCLGRNARFMAQ